VPTYKIKIIKNNVNFNIVSLNVYKTPAGEHVCDERNFVMAGWWVRGICSFNLPQRDGPSHSGVKCS